MSSLLDRAADRELLEMAAKAAAMPDLKSDAFGQYRVIGEHDDGTLCMVPWNPLTDDGDALRLAVKLGIEVRDGHQYDKACAYLCGPMLEFWENFSPDPNAATRRAIVRAAAAIGAAK